MTDSPLPARREAGTQEAISKKLFDPAEEPSSASRTSATATDTTSASRASPASPLRVPQRTSGTRGTARQWAEEVRQSRRNQADASSSSSLASTLRAKDGTTTATTRATAAAGGGTGALTPMASSTLSSHHRTASEMELAQFTATKESESPVRVAGRQLRPTLAVGADGQLPPPPRQQQQQQSPPPQPTSATGSATRRGVAQKFLHNRGASTSQPLFESRTSSRAETPASSSRRSPGGSPSLTNRSPRRSVYLESTEELEEWEQSKQLRLQRVDRLMGEDKERGARNDIRREEADAIMAIMSSYQSFVDAYGIVLRSAAAAAADKARRLSRSASARQTPIPWQTSRTPLVESTSGTPTAASPSQPVSPVAVVSPHRPTAIFTRSGDDDDSALKRLRSVHSGASSSTPSSPFVAVRRSSSVEVERAQALIAEAKEMLSSSDVMRVGSSRGERKQSLSEVEAEATNTERTGVTKVESDSDVTPLDGTLRSPPHVPMLNSTMKPHAQGGRVLGLSNAVSPRSASGTHGPHTPRTARGQPPTHTSQPHLVQSVPRGYDPSIQYVIITYPSFYWISQSKWFRCLVWTPLVWLVKLALLGCGVWFLCALGGVVGRSVASLLN